MSDSEQQEIEDIGLAAASSSLEEESAMEAEAADDDSDDYASYNYKVLSVPTSKVNLLVGKDRARIKVIEATTGVKVAIGEMYGQQTPVTLNGKTPDIQIAENMINDIVSAPFTYVIKRKDDQGYSVFSTTATGIELDRLLKYFKSLGGEQEEKPPKEIIEKIAVMMVGQRMGDRCLNRFKVDPMDDEDDFD